jgi:hypothetical protein
MTFTVCAFCPRVLRVWANLVDLLLAVPFAALRFARCKCGAGLLFLNRSPDVHTSSDVTVKLW